MTTLQNHPILILVSLLLVIVSGFVELAWGRRIQRQGDWVVGVAMLMLLAAMIFSWLGIADGNPEIWVRGWVWPREEAGAITVGLIQDPLGLAMASMAALVGGILVLGRASLSSERFASRAFASIALSVAGIALAWLSATPWLGFLGMAITTFGGFVALASGATSDDEAGIATRFGSERASGQIFAILGACVLASSRGALSWESPQAIAGAAAGGDVTGAWIGASLFVVGVFIHLQPFPLLGWLVREPSESGAYPMRIIAGQVFPALTSFALLVRMEPAFRAIGFFPHFGWIAVASAVLTVGSGLLQSGWHSGLGCLISAGLSLSVSVLCFSGPWNAVSALVGVCLGGAALACAASALECPPPGAADSSTSPQRWVRRAGFVAAAAGTGTIGFVSAGGYTRWISQAFDNPVIAAAFSVLAFFVVLLGWRQAWLVSRISRRGAVSWLAVACPLLLAFLATGLVWNGLAAGTLSVGGTRLFPSLTGVFVGPSAGAPDDPANYLAPQSLFFWGAFVLGLLAAFWTTGRKQDSMEHLRQSLPRFGTFLATGYGFDAFGDKLVRAVTWTGSLAQSVVDDRAWGRYLPDGLGYGLRYASDRISRADAKLTEIVASSLGRWVDAPAKVLQLIQSGDVRWYLFFAVASGVAILAHFLVMGATR